MSLNFILLPAAGGRIGAEVIRAGELPLLLNSCSTIESRHCTLPEQHSRTDRLAEAVVNRTEGGNVGELAPPLICYAAAWARERSPPFPVVPCCLWQAREITFSLTKCNTQDVHATAPAACGSQGSWPPSLPAIVLGSFQNVCSWCLISIHRHYLYYLTLFKFIGFYFMV